MWSFTLLSRCDRILRSSHLPAASLNSGQAPSALTVADLSPNHQSKLESGAIGLQEQRTSHQDNVLYCGYPASTQKGVGREPVTWLQSLKCFSVHVTQKHGSELCLFLSIGSCQGMGLGHSGVGRWHSNLFWKIMKQEKLEFMNLLTSP